MRPIGRILALLLALGVPGAPAVANPADHPAQRVAELVCDHCGKPITDTYITSRGRSYHETCYVDHVAPRCVVCNRPITADFLKDPWGNPFHAEHQADTPQCAYCSRILSPVASKGGFVYPDGRTVCGLCVATAVNDLGKAKQLASGVRKTLAAMGLALAYGEIPLELGDRSWLKAIRARRPSLIAGTEATAFTSTLTRTLNGAVVAKEVAIYALHGMPRDAFSGTIAHELMHAWNHLNCPVRHVPALEEGSANYTEALVLAKLDTPTSRHLLEAIERSDDPAYGEGYRRVKRLVADYGFAGWLEVLRTSADFPLGY